jgi:hypothetical protein
MRPGEFFTRISPRMLLYLSKEYVVAGFSPRSDLTMSQRNTPSENLTRLKPAATSFLQKGDEIGEK